MEGRVFQEGRERMSRPKLKPCPYCGKKTTIRRITNIWWIIGCKTKSYFGSDRMVSASSKEQLINDWNRRKP